MKKKTTQIYFRFISYAKLQIKNLKYKIYYLIILRGYIHKTVLLLYFIICFDRCLRASKNRSTRLITR